jgi:signal peptidase I
MAAALLAALVVGRIWFFTFFWIAQDGMFPTMPRGSYLLAWRKPYESVGEVRRGDVVVFVQENDGRRYNLIWRVVGLPGDTITLAGDKVAVNQRVLEREVVGRTRSYRIYGERLDGLRYSVAYDLAIKRRPPPRVLEVPAGHLFVMGDNRDHAYDSEDYGPIPFASVIAKGAWWHTAEHRPLHRTAGAADEGQKR